MNNDSEAVEGLTRLGLTTYEARVFVALQRLGRGTASQISDVSEVPRSQVYGAAEGLEGRGLVETGQSTPTVYRPVEPEAARRRLLDQLAQTGSETFAYLEAVQNTASGGERSEDIWLVHGRQAVTDRTVEVATEADRRLVYAADAPAMLDDEMLAALSAAAARGVTAIVASSDPAVRESAPPEVATHRVRDQGIDVAVGRVLLVDDDTALLSVLPTAAGGTEEEVAFYSVGSAFAAVLVELGRGHLGSPFAAVESNR